MNVSLSRARGGPILVCFILPVALFASPAARADTTALCKEVDYKIATPTLIAVKCEEKDVSGFIGTGQLYDSPSPLNAPLAVDVEVIPYPGAREWLVLELTPASPSTPRFSLQPAKKYKVVFFLHRPSESAAADATPTAFDLDMSNTVVMSPVDAVSSKGKYEFVSHLAYKHGPGTLCTLQVEDFSERLQRLKATDCTVPAPIDSTKVSSAADLARAAESPEDLGSFQLSLDNGSKGTQQLPTSVPNLTDIFDKPVKLDPKSQLMQEKAPATKDSSKYYVNFNYGAAKGSKPGWLLDEKIAPVIGKLFRGYQFTPTALADVGLNQVGSLKYTDTIDFSVALAHMYQPNSILQGLLFRPGTSYETDREFDRHNFLATPDLQFRLANLYNPQQRRNGLKYSREVKIADAKKIPWTRANSKPVLLGYVLDFHTGLEVGGALTDTTVKASVGKMTLSLPSYHIARLVPQAHALFEIGRFSIDAVGTARYLMTVENSVLERTDHSLFLKRLHGWNAYGVVAGSWNFDPAGHFALTVAYKDGFSPPRFSRVNTVQSGITLKY